MAKFKLKTRKAVSKRIYITGTGKFRYNRAGKRHLLTGKSSRRVRRLTRPGLLTSADRRRVQAAMPYSG